MSITENPPQPGSREASLNALNSSRTNAPEIAQVHALLAIAGAIEGLTEALRNPMTPEVLVKLQNQAPFISRAEFQQRLIEEAGL